jgi:ABC-type sugar transport system permease subunit
VEDEEREKRRKAFLWTVMIMVAVAVLGAGGVGLGLGLSEQSTGWGFAGALLFCLAGFVASWIAIAIVGGRSGLKQIGGIYSQAARRTITGRTIRWASQRRRSDPS